jgi:hypothetical protein
VIQESQKTVTEKTISHQQGNPFLKDLEIFLTFHSPEYLDKPKNTSGLKTFLLGADET